jgi:hypothetical protein
MFSLFILPYRFNCNTLKAADPDPEGLAPAAAPVASLLNHIPKFQEKHFITFLVYVLTHRRKNNLFYVDFEMFAMVYCIYIFCKARAEEVRVGVGAGAAYRYATL